MFCGLGVFSQTGYLLVVTWLFGGDASAIAPLLVLTLKVATVSLASVTVFSGMDPDKLANGLMWFSCPEQLSFSISYAYRMLPILMEEFQNVLLSYRLRGNPPAHDTLWGKIRYLAYQTRPSGPAPPSRCWRSRATATPPPTPKSKSSSWPPSK